MTRTIRSFVRRTGKISKAQNEVFEKEKTNYLVTSKEKLHEIINNNLEKPLILEVGFGVGTSLAEQAKMHPDYLFIGIEVHKPGIAKIIKLIKENESKNIFVIEHDAIEILEQWLNPNSLDKFQLFFPDPWPKKKHHKRRIVNEQFVSLVHRCLKSQVGIIHIATDWENYAEHVQNVFNNHIDKFESYGSENIIAPRLKTKFEKRGIDLGHEIFDMVYKKGL